MADRRVTFLIGANIRDFQKNINRAQKRFKRFSKSLEESGKTLSQNVSMPVAAAGAAAVKFAADFESAMVEVQKVTDQTTADALSGEIREMAETIPMAQTELAGLAADAARFGVRGTNNIKQFTRTTAMMAEATDLAANEAGTALAKIANQANIPQKEIGNIGSAINELSNNFATSSSEIVGAMQRSSAAAAQFGLSGQEIAGLSAQMNAMSESSERAGTRMRRLFQELTNPKKVAKYANALGMTTTEFKQMQKNNPQQLLMRLVQAMSDGGSAADQLKTSLSSTSRQAVTALSQDVGALNNALSTSEKAFKENTSLQKEFDAATDTFTARVKLLWNQIKDLGITIGNILIPPLRDLINNYISPAIKAFQGMSEQAQRMVVVGAGIAAAIGPAILVFGKLATVLMSLMSPVTAVIAGLVAIAGAITYAVKNWEAIKERISDISWWRNALVDMIQFFINYNPFTKMIEGVNALLSYFGKTTIPNPFADVADALEGLKADTKEYENDFQSFGEFIGDVGSDVKGWFDGITDSILGASSATKDAAKNAKEFGKAIGTQSIDTGGAATQQVKIEPVKDVAQGKSITDIAIPPEEMKKLQRRQEQLKQKSRQIASAISQGISNSLTTLAEGIGKMATGAASAGDVFKSLLGVMLNLAKRVGKIAIGVGIAVAGIKEALKSLNPIAAIAAGTALIALASIAQSALSKAANKGGGGDDSSPGDQPRGGVGMAKGGMVPQGFPNDSYPAQLSSGEAVLTPEDQQELIRNVSKSRGQQMIHNVVNIDGRPIYESYEKTSNKRKR